MARYRTREVGDLGSIADNCDEISLCCEGCGRSTTANVDELIAADGDDYPVARYVDRLKCAICDVLGRPRARASIRLAARAAHWPDPLKGHRWVQH